MGASSRCGELAASVPRMCSLCMPCALTPVWRTSPADGTFVPEVGVARRGASHGGLALAATAALALAAVALVYANTSSEWPGSALMSEGQRTTKLAWGGFTLAMQDEADKALRLCKVGLLGPNQHCATHVVSTDDTKWTHSDAGQPTWEESQMVLSRQVCAPPCPWGASACRLQASSTCFAYAWRVRALRSMGWVESALLCLIIPFRIPDSVSLRALFDQLTSYATPVECHPARPRYRHSW